MCTAGAGAAIAPPPSLTETSEPPSGQENDDTSSNKSRNAASRGLDVAAKIMAKYGYKVSFVAYATSLEITPQKFGVSRRGMEQKLNLIKLGQILIYQTFYAIENKKAKYFF